MFKILSTYICWKKYMKCNIWRVAVCPSCIWDARFLKVKCTFILCYTEDILILQGVDSCFSLLSNKTVQSCTRLPGVVTSTRCCRYSCLRSWWWVEVHPKHVEQFPDINKLCKVASCWIYIGILSMDLVSCHSSGP